MKSIKLMKIIYLTSIPLLLCLFLIFVLSADPFPIFSFQKKPAPVDWAQANSKKLLEDKYNFLVEEYKRIAADWEKNIYGEFSSIISQKAIEELSEILDSKLHLINPYLFQKWASDNVQPQAYEIASNEKIQDIIENWSHRSSLILEEQKDFGFLHKFIAATWTWKIYTHLIQELDRANLIFYEGFESGDLSRWDMTGAKDNISLDSQKKAHGEYSLKLHTNNHYNPVQSTIFSTSYLPSKIHIQWQVWLSSIEKECAQCSMSFKFLGTRTVLSSSRNLINFVYAADRDRKEIEIQPDVWHLFEIICNYEEGLMDVFVDGETIWERMSIKTEESAQIQKNRISISYSDFFGIPAWIDEIKISYIS